VASEKHTQAIKNRTTPRPISVSVSSVPSRRVPLPWYHTEDYCCLAVETPGRGLRHYNYVEVEGNKRVISYIVAVNICLAKSWT